MLSKLLSVLVLPPLIFIMLCIAGMAIALKQRRAGYFISIASLVLLTVFSTVAGSWLVVAPLENLTRPLGSVREVVGAQAQAIVVLGAGRVSNAPEYEGSDMPTLRGIQRIRYAARLHRQTGLPLLVSGGAPLGDPGSEAASMAEVLREDFGTPVRWEEADSHTTAENASYSARLLHPLGVRRILLVTDAMHMPRSAEIFRGAGFDVVEAPTLFFSRGNLTVNSYMPNGEALNLSYYAMREWVGRAWYRLRY